MNLKTLLSILFIVLCSCRSSEDLISKSYNLKGEVKIISEKTIPSICDSNSVVKLDSSKSRTVGIRNLFFDKDGRILKWEVFKGDSVLTSYHDYLYSESGKFIKLNSYKNGELDYYVIIRNRTNTSLVTETFDFKTNKLAAVFKIKYSNGLVSKMKIRDFKNKNHQSMRYKFDSLGNEIERARITDYGVKVNISYMEFDSVGNWTKRIEYYDEDKDCDLVVRRIEYH